MFLSKHNLTEDEIKEIKESWDKPGAILKCPGRMYDDDTEETINLKMKKAILDCWDLLEPKPYYRCRSLSSRIPALRDKEIIENQTNLLDDLRNIIESIANEIMKQED